MSPATFLLLASLTFSPFARGESKLNIFEPKKANDAKTYLAQYDGDDAYDPFADYSEFEETSQEEADIHFFRNGRFFNVAFLGGTRMFTQNLKQLYKSNTSFGFYLAYFFDLRFALQLSYTFSDHPYYVPPNPQTASAEINGSVSFSTLALMVKYYFNVQNVTKGLADLNPYVILGLGQNYRTTLITNETVIVKDEAIGFNGGFGIEIPFARNSMYFGAQYIFQVVNFANENTFILDTDNNVTNVFPKGDEMNLHLLLGINF